MKPFDLLISGDMAQPSGEPVGDLGFAQLATAPWIHWDFVRAQMPRPGDSTYQERLYSLELTAADVAAAHGIVVCRPWLKAAALAAGAPKLLAIGRAGIGYDKLDLAACTAANVVVYNAPHALTHATATAALFLILGCSRRLWLQQRIVREGRWDLQQSALGDDLEGLTLGMIGYGKTAQELVRLLAPFRMKLIAYSPHASPETAVQDGVTLLPTAEAVFRQADYVSLHNRLTPHNHGSIGEALLGLMKPTAFLINIARGEIVDEPALIRCLGARRIAGAGLDVFAQEPLPLGSRLLELENVILTPHWLCSTRQSGLATWTSVMKGMCEVSSGRVPENVLNPAVLDRPGFRAKLQAFAANG